MDRKILENNFHWKTVIKNHYELIRRRNEEVDGLLLRANTEEIAQRIVRIKNKFLQLVDIDYASCDLKPHVLDIKSTDGYIIENVLIQALPDYFIPINIYRPKISNTEKLPGIIVPVGHYPEGKQK